ncbi:MULTISPECIES: LysR family transcriptional regulator [unclassified Rhizobacter]|uniref:LysR family transcriptional regulator n=1 Tax=unclassified Rhizobacter TaxID=2640088 RepID=UPI0006F8A2E2|nr:MULTISPECIES: LysR family transcriptional regulator [unclassified Rhizobacter]KQU69112.1 LysR family transcriptional regulator [Rhizobacter sp. Root29]KQW03916.1 LysR family transcriptional regulator [Rhizobacter sp. Root1238]KRB21555.1 LysR family transcriptional regulator [Rhizobacter sp. Root16D2]
MTFTQLEIFALVAELGGFTAAASRLGIGQSAASHALKALEKELRVSLISRHPTALKPTEVGRQVLLRAREILNLAEALKQEAAAAGGLSRGVLRIGSFGPTSSVRLLPGILAEFRHGFPGIEVRVDEGEDSVVARWILEGRVDVGFVVLPDERFDTTPLLVDELMALVPAAHPLSKARSIAPADLVGVPFILTQAGSSSLVESRFSALGLRPDIRHRVSQMVTILSMVDRGEGVSIVAEHALPDRLDSHYPGVVARPLRPVARRQIGLAVRSLRQASPAAKEFLKIAARVCRPKPAAKKAAG